MFKTIDKHLKESFIAGFLIAIATILYLILLPVNSILAAFMFSAGLYSVFSYNVPLFTGVSGRFIEGQKSLSNIGLILIGNLVGVAFVALVLAPNMLVTIPTLSISGIVARSFICGIFIEAAVQSKYSNTAILSTILYVMGFLLSGGAHCIVWAFYFIYGCNINPLYLIVIIIGNFVGCNFIGLLKKEKN